MKGIDLGYSYVPMPLAIWDECIELSVSEFRLLGYLIRRQIKFGQATVGMTKDEIMHGPEKNGKRLDAGCGLSKNSLNTAIECLEKRGWIEIKNISEHPRFSQLLIRVLMSNFDLERQKFTIEGQDLTIGRSKIDDSLAENQLDFQLVTESTLDKGREPKEEDRTTTTVQRWVNLWNENRGTLPEVRKLTTAIEREILLRSKEYSDEEFTDAVQMCAMFPFTRGENERKWKATFIWLLRGKTSKNDDGTIGQVLNGKYGERPKKAEALTWDEYNEETGYHFDHDRLCWLDKNNEVV
jgi:hypothetical protein